MKFRSIVWIAAATFPVAFTSCIGRDIPPGQVPSVVVNTLHKAYPAAANVEWEKQKATYTAEFDVGATEYTVLLNSAGQLVQSKRDIGETELPAAVKNYLSGKYRNDRVDDAELLEKNGRLYYQVELHGNAQDTKLVLDATGNEQKEITYWED
ncbi:MAG TPA: hypothetical protein VIG72_07150 [Pontibacter sp.]